MDGVSAIIPKSRRERWTDTIAGHRERLLSFGSATELIQPPEAVSLDWHSFIEKLDEPAAILQCLVLANETSVTLVRDELPALYRALRRTTTARPMVSRRGLTGTPLWQRTLRERAANGGDKAIYVVASTARSSDVPENRGLVSCLAYLDALVGSLSRVAGGEQRLPKPLQTVGQEARLGLRLPALRDLPMEPLLPTRSRQAMARSRLATFERLSDLSLRLRDVQDASRADLVVSLAAAGWLSPLSDDDLFELYVLTRVLQILSERWGQPAKLSPIRMGEVIAQWTVADGISIEVHFDMTPAPLRHTSRYLHTSRDYPGVFNASARRPDIIIATRKGKRTVYTFVEVKNPAENSDAYRRHSLYKCFGYLYDFADLLDHENEADVCFLVFPDKVAINEDATGGVGVVSGDQGTALHDRLLARLERVASKLVN